MSERIDGGRLLLTVGAVALLVSLFLDWYGVGGSGFGSEATAWTVFEIVDLLLAAIAVAALVGAFGPVVPRAGLSAPPPNAAPVLGGVALLLVVLNLINLPPAANDASLETGAWIALGGAVLMAAGGILGIARVSLVVTLSPRERRARTEAPAPSAAGEPALFEDEPETVDEPEPLAEPEPLDEEQVDLEEEFEPGMPADADETRPLPVDEEEPPGTEEQERL
jgi:hypothetical protein